MWLKRLKTGEGPRRIRIGKDVTIFVQKVGEGRTVLAIEANGLQIREDGGSALQGIDDAPPDVVGI